MNKVILGRVMAARLKNLDQRREFIGESFNIQEKTLMEEGTVNTDPVMQNISKSRQSILTTFDWKILPLTNIMGSLRYYGIKYNPCVINSVGMTSFSSL